MNNRKHAYFFLAGLMAMLVAAQNAPAADKSFSQVISSPDADYVIDVQGTLDPENVEIVIENLGDLPVVNPRISVNGKYDWFDEQAILAEVFADPEIDTGEEKALALWEWVLFKRFQRTAGTREAVNPVLGLNGFGYGLCGNTAAWLKGLGAAAGLQVRIQEIWGHTINEFFFNGAWHMLDGNAKHFYLNRDNLTIASLKQLEDDCDLVRRAFFVFDPWSRTPSLPVFDDWVEMYESYKDNYLEESYDSRVFNHFTMASTLRPGESLTRWWKPVLNIWENRARREDAPEIYANGRLVWEPDPRRIDLHDYIEVVENVTTRARDGKGPSIHIEDLHDRFRERPSRFAIEVRSPYPIIGGQLWARMVRQGTSPNDIAAISFGEPSLGSGNLFNYTRGGRERDVEIDLDGSLQGGGPVNSYKLGFTLKGDGAAEPPTQSGLESFRLESDIQVSPHSLPALALGRNVIRYHDSSGEGRKVRITHVWREVADNRPPRAVAGAVAPVSGQTVKSLAPVLEWNAAADPDRQDTVPDYQIMLSLRPDCRWPLSPYVHQTVNDGTTNWRVPAGYLNPGATYYWKIKARDSRGAESGWSDIFSFTTSDDAN